jgi:ArsR family transcriptional regulator
MELNVILEPGMGNLPYDPQVQVFKLLTHPARIAILNLLRDGERCVCHLEAHMGFRQAYISQQLAVLREAGLVQDRRDGWNIYYRVIEPRIFEVLDSAARMMKANPEAPVTAAAVNCPCPQCNASSGQ